jgi:uncharacterized phage protein (TIGR02218 family)
MSYTARESSVCDGKPFELFLFQTLDQTWRVTSADVGRAHLGHDYTPEAITRTETQKSSETKGNNIKVSIRRDHPIAGLFRAYMPVTPLSLVVYRGHDSESEIVVAFTGRVTQANMIDVCELTCAPEEDVLRRALPTTVFQTPCNRIIYSAACGVTRSSFRVDGLISAVSGVEIHASAFDSGVDGYLTNGYVEIGNMRRMIIHHVGDKVTLIAPMLLPLVIGDAISAYPGCARTHSDCVNKFSNGPRFLGFEMIPTRNPFNGLLY